MNMFTRSVTALALLATLLFVAAGVMLTYEVAARYFFIRPTIWAAELSQACLIWGALIASPWCLRERRHIRITAVISHLPRPARIVADVFAMLAVAVFSAVVLVADAPPGRCWTCRSGSSSLRCPLALQCCWCSR